MLRAALSFPTTMKAGCCPDAAELVIDRYSGSLLFD
jgi:hypothetical protein